MLHLNVCVCTHVEFIQIGNQYMYVGSLDPVQDSMYIMAYLPMSINLPSVFKIHKIQDQSVNTTYLTACRYSYQQLAFSKSCLLAIIAKISYQIAWPMTLTPTYETIKGETSGKPSIREKPAEFLGTGHPCKDCLLPSIMRNIYESVEMFY